MKILADIGGTYARFVTVENDALVNPQKYRAADFETLEAALEEYCADKRGTLSIATAAYEDNNEEQQIVWRFINQNKWVINPEAFEQAGWTIGTILNDFAAATWGLLSLDQEEQNVLHFGAPDDLPRSLIGPGTGLGLGYLIPTKDGPHIQRTHGGHMMTNASTEEQWLIVKTVQRIKGDTTAPVFENFVSGPGLYNIYCALYLIAGKKPIAENTEDLLDHLDDKLVQEALRLFHEFFGLFARTITITAHAYGGLYLTGGVLDRLHERGLFDYETFRTYFLVRGVDSVSQALSYTPIIHITEPHLAMKGLLEYEAKNH